MELDNYGSFTLSASQNVVTPETPGGLAGIDKMIETKEGNLIALINRDETMFLYTKELGKTTWDLLMARDDLYGYALCETAAGLLVGASNLEFNNRSGLYLLQGDKLVNILLQGAPIPHVQFIKNFDNQIFVYGNDYSALYSFNINALEKFGDALLATAVTSEPFDNQFFIEQFELSRSAANATAVLRTRAGHVYFYQKKSTGAFEQVVLNNGQFADQFFSTVIIGRSTDSPYNTYLCLSQDYQADAVVMENRENGRLVLNALDIKLELKKKYSTSNPLVRHRLQ